MDVVLGIAGSVLVVLFVVSWFTMLNNDEDGAAPDGAVRRWAMRSAIASFAANALLRAFEPQGAWRWSGVLVATLWTAAILVWAPLEWRRRRTRTVVRTHQRRFGDRYIGGPPPGDG